MKDTRPSRWRFWLAFAFVSSPLWGIALLLTWLALAKPGFEICHEKADGTEICYKD